MSTCAFHAMEMAMGRELIMKINNGEKAPEKHFIP